MKKFGYTAIVIAALGAGALGSATPAGAVPVQYPAAQVIVAPAGIDHLGWLDDVHYGATAPKVDTGVRHSR